MRTILGLSLFFLSASSFCADTEELVSTWIAQNKKDFQCPKDAEIQIDSSLNNKFPQTNWAEIYCKDSKDRRVGPFLRVAHHLGCEGFYNCPEHGGKEVVSGSYLAGKKHGKWTC